MATPDQLADLFSDNRRIDELGRAIQRIAAAVEKLAGSTDKASQGVAEVAGGIEKAGEAFKNTQKELEDFGEASEDVFDKFDVFKQRMQGFAASLGLKDVRTSVERLGAGFQRLGTDAEGSVMQMIRSIPYVGGVLEFMINTANYSDKFRANAAKGFMQFEQTSVMSVGQLNKMSKDVGSRVQELTEKFKDSEMGAKFAASMAALAQGGVTAEGALAKTSSQISLFRNNVMETSAAIDTAFELGHGQSTQWATRFARETSGSVSESLDMIYDLGVAAKNTGANMQNLVGHMLQVTSAMRTQGSDARDLGAAYMNIQKHLRNTVDPKVTNMRVDEMTGDALLGLGSFLGNMGDDLKGFIMDDVGAGIMGDKFKDMGFAQKMHHMDTGFAHSDSGDTAKEFQRLTLKTAWEKLGNLDDYEKVAFLKKHGNMPASTRQALLEAADQPGGVASMLTDHSAYSKLDGRKKELEDKLELEKPLKNTTFQNMMQEIQTLMRSLGEAMLQSLSTLIRVSVGGFEMLANPLSMDKKKQFRQMLTEEGDKLGTSFTSIGDALKPLGVRAVDVFKDFGGIKDGSALPPLKAYDEKAATAELVTVIESKSPIDWMLTPQLIHVAGAFFEIKALPAMHRLLARAGQPE